MATVYYWTIGRMDVVPSEDGLTDVVKTVFWNRNADCDHDSKIYTASTFGALDCNPPDPMAFTPYQDLTFDQVCGWLNDNYNVLSLDEYLDSQIEIQINPPVVTLPIPWDTTTTTTTTIFE